MQIITVHILSILLFCLNVGATTYFIGKENLESNKNNDIFAIDYTEKNVKHQFSIVKKIYPTDDFKSKIESVCIKGTPEEEHPGISFSSESMYFVCYETPPKKSMIIKFIIADKNVLEVCYADVIKEDDFFYISNQTDENMFINEDLYNMILSESKELLMLNFEELFEIKMPKSFELKNADHIIPREGITTDFPRNGLILLWEFSFPEMNEKELLNIFSSNKEFQIEKIDFKNVKINPYKYIRSKNIAYKCNTSVIQVCKGNSGGNLVVIDMESKTAYAIYK